MKKTIPFALLLFALISPVRADEASPASIAPAAEASDIDLGDRDLLAKTRAVVAARPSWVSQSPIKDGDLHSIVVSSGPYVTASEAHRVLDEALAASTAEYIREFLGSDYAPNVLRYDIGYIEQHLVSPQHRYDESQWFSVGEMRQSYAMLTFTPEFRGELTEKWRRVVSASRLAQTGLIVGAAFSLLVVGFGYLRADTVTRGYYTRRLQLATLATILGLLAAGSYITQWIHWL